MSIDQHPSIGPHQYDPPALVREIPDPKSGLVLVVRRATHFVNLYVFARLRRRSCERSAVPPTPRPDPLARADA